MIYDIVVAICKILMALMGLELRGAEKLENARNCLICANHISANDPPFIGSILRFKVNFLAKAELFANPLMKAVFNSVNAIPVRRGKVDRFALNEVEKRLEAGESVVVFPEGTRKSTKVKAGIGKFAMDMNKNILPIYIENSDDILGCIFGKKHLKISVGDQINADNFSEWESTKENWRKLAHLVMDKINELKD